MLTKHSSYLNKPEKYVKRRYSQALENDQQNEPTIKLRKMKNGKTENDSDYFSFFEEITNSQGAEFQDFLKHFMIPSNIYKNLAQRHKTHPLILKRNLSYLNKQKLEIPRSNLKTISDHLSTVQFHDENMAIMKGKYPNKINFPSYPNKISIKFDQFMDSKSEKDWRTIEASVYLDVIHFYRDNRKNKEGFLVKRLLSDIKVKCCDGVRSDDIVHAIDIGSAIQMANSYRVYKSVFHFKVLAKEKRNYSKQNFLDKKTEEKQNEEFPVTYEAMMPLFSNMSNRNIRSGNYFVQSGKYQIFMEVTDMEKCDDSPYSGQIKSIYNEGFDSKSHNIDCQWYKIDEPQHHLINKNKPRIIFQIENQDQNQEKQKPMQTRNKSLPPIIKLSPYKTGELRLSSITLKEKPVIDVNIAYKFVAKDKIVQWTQTKHLLCPWCQLSFHSNVDIYTALKQLLAHLNNWHPKLTFINTKLKSRAIFNEELSKNFITIDVKLTDSTKSLQSDIGQVICDQFPTRRMPITELIHSKHKKPLVKVQRKNHNRHYSHTWSADSLKDVEFDIDSEAEENQRWLFDHYHRKVDEFTDLNHIEKCVIQMWNHELLRYGIYLSDKQIKPFVMNFVDGIINDVKRLRLVKSMRNTFMLHLVNLIDYGLLSSVVMLQCMKRLDEAFEKI